MKNIKVGLLGLGTVGSGVFKVLKRNQAEISRRAGRKIEISMVANLNIEKAKSLVGAEAVITNNAQEIINNPDINVIVELIGGYTTAKDFVLQSIRAGKHVVTANKALLAVHGTEIFKEAEKYKVIVAYEAAVAGGIPIIKALREGLSANKINWIAGIINGTTNFILSQMRNKSLDFESALKQAQSLGYAEADPTFDIEGVDAAHKITLMASMAFGIPVQFDKTYVEGITKLSTIDINYAQQLGYRIKLLGITKRTETGIELRVHPTLIPEKRLIASVEDVMNAVVVNSDALGTTLYYGRGAGSEPTASAVIADLVDIARLSQADEKHRVPVLAFQNNTLTKASENLPILSMDKVLTSYYLRLRVVDEVGVLAKITQIFLEFKISIDAILQKETENNENQTDLIILTHEVKEGQLNLSLIEIQKINSVINKIIKIRKENLSD